MKDVKSFNCGSQLQPFLKWPGGKRWLAPWLAELVQHELNGVYCEPFAGAAAVFLALRPERSRLSDTNKELIAFFETIRDKPDRVVSAMSRWTNTAKCYSRVRDSRPVDRIQRAARFLFLNRTCWGGIYRLNRNGDFNVPFGNSGRRICSREQVRAVCDALSSAELSAADFEEIMDRAIGGDVIYADPPYTTRGENNGFVRYNELLFSWHDQQRLAETAGRAKRRGVFVAVSGLLHEDILSLYSGWWTLQLSRQSSVGRDRKSRRISRRAGIVLQRIGRDGVVVPR